MGYSKKRTYTTLLLSTGVLLSLMGQVPEVHAEEDTQTYQEEELSTVHSSDAVETDEHTSNAMKLEAVDTAAVPAFLHEVSVIEQDGDVLLSFVYDETTPFVIAETADQVSVIKAESELPGTVTLLLDETAVQNAFEIEGTAETTGEEVVFTIDIQEKIFSVEAAEETEVEESDEDTVTPEEQLEETTEQPIEEETVTESVEESAEVPVEEVTEEDSQEELASEETVQEEPVEETADESEEAVEEPVEESVEEEAAEEDVQPMMAMFSLAAEVPSADELYKKATTAGGASARWAAAVEGIELYPSDARFVEALNSAAQRQLNLGLGHHQNNEYASAIIYYDNILNGPEEVSAELQREVQRYKNQAFNGRALETADDLYETAVSSPSASSRWDAAVEGISVYPGQDRFVEALKDAGQRLLNMGMNHHQKKEFNSANVYYNQILSGPDAVGAELKAEATMYRDQADKRAALVTQDDYLYNVATKDSGATNRWNAALEGYRLYPSQDRFAQALSDAGQLQMRQGIKYHNRKEFAAANSYFTNILNAPNAVGSSLKEEARIYQALAERNEDLVTADDLYDAATSSSTATERWEAAVQGVELYPSQSRFVDALADAGNRQLAQGTKNHRNKDFGAALIYYNNILNGPSEISASLKEKAQAYKTQAESKRTLVTDDQLHNTAVNSSASSRWDAAVEGVSLYPTQNRFVAALADAGARMVSVGKGQHQKGNHSEASRYYNIVMDYEAYLPTSTVTLAESYNYLAENNLNLVNAIYETSEYAQSLDEMVDAQMRRNPQTDTYNGKWRTAKRKDVEYYVDSTNFLPKAIKTTDSRIQALQVATGTLNVRSGPGTRYGVVAAVHNNEEYRLIGQSNGWFQIDVNGTHGWVSGAYVTLLGAPRSVEFANVPSSMLQFLTLSGSSGVSAASINKELSGAGIFEGKGAAFIEASQLNNINEMYLLAHALLESGHGTSRLATGVLVDEVDGQKVAPKVVYNMYGIGAFDNSALKSGSEMAYKQGWDTPEKAIIGGAQWIASRYINNSHYRQDTLYKMRWNPNSPGNHQYATDIGWAYKQTHTLDSVVTLSQKHDLVLRFDVPVYRR